MKGGLERRYSRCRIHNEQLVGVQTRRNSFRFFRKAQARQPIDTLCFFVMVGT